MDKCCHITTFLHSCNLKTEYDTLRIRVFDPVQHIRSYGCGVVEEPDSPDTPDNPPALSFWQEVAEIVRNGEASTHYKLGDIFEVEHSQFGKIEFEVVGFDQHTPVDSEKKHTMALLSKHTIMNAVFDEPEQDYCLTEDIVFDVCKKLTANINGSSTNTRFTRYGDDFWRSINGSYELVREDGVFKLWEVDSTTYERKAIVDEHSAPGTVLDPLWTSGTVLTTYNVYYIKSGTRYTTAKVTDGDYVEPDTYYEQVPSTQRSGYGYSNWKESNIRQWLNSDLPAGMWFVPQNKWDNPPAYAETMAGFMQGFLDFDFVTAVCPVVNTTVRDAYSSSGGFDITEDKFFLPSGTEVVNKANGGMYEGTVLEMLKGAKANDLKKTDVNGVDTSWWLRTTSTSVSRAVFFIKAGKSVTSSVNEEYGIAVLCAIG